MKFLKAAGLVLLSSAVGAGELYVDCNDPQAADDVADGRGTAALPYKTIQAAVDAAASGDTVYVKPGIYDSGTTKSPEGQTTQDNRVVITKKLHLVSTGGAKVTEIRGRHGTDYCGLGPTSVRTVFIAQGGEESVVEGFTLGNGATLAGNSVFNSQYTGGGFYAPHGGYLVDSVVTNCVATFGGGMCGGTAVRTFFRGCGGRWWDSGAAHTANLWNCVVHHDYFWSSTYAGQKSLTNVTNVNCTVVLDNRMYADYQDCQSYNLLSLSFKSDEVVSDTDPAQNCVYTKTAKTNRFCSNPFRGDFRLLPDCAAHGAGDAQWLESVIHLPASIRRTDFTGTDLTGLTGAIAAGASQQDHTPAHGGIVLSTDGIGYCVDGINLPVGGYLFAETWPVRWMVADWPQLSPTDASVPKPALFISGGAFSSSGGSMRRVPTPDGRNSIIPSPTAGELTSLWRCPAQQLIWADAENGSDETGDGTEQNPYKTLQRAVDAQTRNYAIICAKPGTYDEGGKEANGLFNRVVTTYASGRETLIRGVEGAERTFLVGATNATDSIRCASLNDFAYLQGFTLKDGRSCGATDGSQRGAAVYNGSLYDCIVSNCEATTYLTFQIGAHRTRFVNNTCGSAAHYGSQNWSWCAFAHNTVTGGTLISGAGNPALYNCTFTANDTGTQSIIANNFVEPNNCILEGTGGPLLTFTGGGLGNNIYWNVTIADPTDMRYRKADPRLALKEANDFHPTIGSGAVAAGDFWLDLWYMTDAYLYATADVYGNHFTPRADGKMHMGAVQEGFLCEYAVNPPPYGGLALTGAAFGTNVLQVGESVTLTVAEGADATRRCLGFVVRDAAGGLTTNLFASLPGGAWTKTITSDPADSLWIDACYSPDWYVDAENGDDARDGLTPETAKKTLAAAVTNALVRTGDVIHALPGVYREGVVKYRSDDPSGSRVMVPDGVTLVSTEGAVETTIEGAKSESNEGGGGLGTDAVRCVWLSGTARIKGFTLTGGRAYHQWSDARPWLTRAGGVYAASQNGVVEDCVISKCAASPTTAYKGTFIRCKALGGQGTTNAMVFEGSLLVDCLVTGGSGDQTVGIDSCTVYNSTVIPLPGWHVVNGGVSKFYNSVVFGWIKKTSEFYNCILAANTDGRGSWGRWDGDIFQDPANAHDCKLLCDADVALSHTDWTPLTADAQTVDAGNNAYVYPEYLVGRTDLLGVPRILNGAVDIGYSEWDWRPAYKKVLGRFVTFDSISTNVVLAGEKVRLAGDGAQLAIALAAKEGTSGYVVPYEVTGPGALTVTVNGVAVPTVASGAGVIEAPSQSESKVVFTFAGEGHVDLGLVKRLSGLLLLVR